MRVQLGMKPAADRLLWKGRITLQTAMVWYGYYLDISAPIQTRRIQSRA